MIRPDLAAWNHENKTKTPEQFWSMVAVGDASDCWPWLKGTGRGGYGKVRWHGKTHPAHRIAFLLTYGHMPTPQANHVNDCRRDCCNPQHIYEGTALDNNRDIVRLGHHKWAGRTHCLRGHEFTPHNTWLDSKGHRWCRACDAYRHRRRKQRIWEQSRDK